MRDHPCFSCTLPDCDETSKACRWKHAHRNAVQKKAKGQEPEAIEAAVAKEYAVYRWVDWMARKAEAGKPVRGQEKPHA